MPSASPACKLGSNPCLSQDQGDVGRMISPGLKIHPNPKALCFGSQSRTPFCVRLGQGQESSMTLTILDPRFGEKVTIYVENVPAVRQPVAAKVVTHPRFRKPH